MRTVLNILNFVLGVRHHPGLVTGNAGQYRAYFYFTLDPFMLGDNLTFAVSSWQRSDTCR